MPIKKNDLFSFNLAEEISLLFHNLTEGITKAFQPFAQNYSQIPQSFENISNHIYELKDRNLTFGANVQIHYLKNVSDTIDVNEFVKQLTQLHNRTTPIFGNLFEGLNIQIWNPLREDCPVNTETCDPKTHVCNKTYGIGNYAGLTTAEYKLIELNSATLQTPLEMANCFSHEFGHLIAYNLDFYNEKNPIKILWNTFRGTYATQATPTQELIAEDFRLLFGSDPCLNFERTDSFNYIQVSKMPHMKSFYTLWMPLMKILNKDCSQVSCSYNNDNECTFMFLVTTGKLLFTTSIWKKFNKDGLFSYNPATKIWKKE